MTVIHQTRLAEGEAERRMKPHGWQSGPTDEGLHPRVRHANRNVGEIRGECFLMVTPRVFALSPMICLVIPSW